jgi:leader peptidase (prepilin peptidase)/N-methyltransferase
VAVLEVVTAVVCGLFGLLAGSFANVVIARVPAGGSVVRPASACPTCAAPIAPADNIPVLSWLRLGGRCRRCKAPISARYPLVELACGLLFAGIGAQLGLDWALPGFLLFGWTLLVLASIDAATRRIPNRLTYPLTPALVVLLVAGGLLNGSPQAALGAVLGGLAAFAALLLLALISPQGMGMGDVKLAGFIGAGLGYLGWGYVVLGIFGGFLLGGVVALALLATRLRTRKDLLPFGPYLALAAVVTLFAGQPLIAEYQALVGLS